MLQRQRRSQVPFRRDLCSLFLLVLLLLLHARAVPMRQPLAHCLLPRASPCREKKDSVKRVDLMRLQ